MADDRIEKASFFITTCAYPCGNTLTASARPVSGSITTSTGCADAFAPLGLYGQPVVANHRAVPCADAIAPLGLVVG
jgi:hypothetical protein